MALFILFLSYSFFVYTVGTSNENTTMNFNAVKGKYLFQKYNCAACHQLFGLGGYLGPELTKVISTQGKGEAYATAFIQSGTRRMPDFHLEQQEVSALVDYLKYVDKTAVNYKFNK